MKRTTSILQANYHLPQLSTIHLRKDNKKKTLFYHVRGLDPEHLDPEHLDSKHDQIIASSRPAVSLMVSGPWRQL
jgi:hypothetical protein